MPVRKSVKVYLNSEEYDKLNYLSEIRNKPKSRVLRDLISEDYYQEVMRIGYSEKSLEELGLN